MHYHTEIIMPPTSDVEAAVASIMAPFDENSSDEESASAHRFWDWYVIGGRWSGAKVQAKLGGERLSAFMDKLQAMKVTVSGLQCGKQELQPASQIDVVDALWRADFPESGLDKCPLFKHSGDTLPGDVCKLSELPADLSAVRVIIARPADDFGPMRAEYMAQEDFWNGCNHVRSTWDMKVASAVADHTKRLQNYTEEARAKLTPREDWLVVTVDYHS